MDERPSHEENDTPEDGEQGTPTGAIGVTLFLAATILVLWFGMFALNAVRN